MIYSILESNIRSAVDNEDNQFKDGSINWCFVDADAYHACHKFFKDDETFYEYFHDIANKIHVEMNPVSNEIQLEMEGI